MDELLISPEAVAAYEADLDEIVNAGKQRRLEHYSAPSTTAGSNGTNDRSGRIRGAEWRDSQANKRRRLTSKTTPTGDQCSVQAGRGDSTAACGMSRFELMQERIRLKESVAKRLKIEGS